MLLRSEVKVGSVVSCHCSSEGSKSKWGCAVSNAWMGWSVTFTKILAVK